MCMQIKEKDSQGAQPETTHVHVYNSASKAWHCEKTFLFFN